MYIVRRRKGCIKILSVTRGNVISSFLRDTTDGIRAASSRYAAKENIDLISFVIHARAIFASSPVLRTSHPIFLRIYFPEDVASEIFQGLISPGIALLIQDWEMLHSLLKLFECDSCPNLRKMQDVARCRAVNFFCIQFQTVSIKF